jgi:hypothetical protein
MDMGLYTWSLELLIPYSDGVNLLGDKVTRCCICALFILVGCFLMLDMGT